MVGHSKAGYSMKMRSSFENMRGMPRQYIDFLWCPDKYSPEIVPDARFYDNTKNAACAQAQHTRYDSMTLFLGQIPTLPAHASRDARFGAILLHAHIMRVS